MRFDGGTNVGGPQEEEWSWEADRQGSQDSATKDSGIDTSSTFTSSEDSNRGDLPKVRGQVTSEQPAQKKKKKMKMKTLENAFRVVASCRSKSVDRCCRRRSPTHVRR